MKINLRKIVIFIYPFCFLSCEKYLNEKSDKKLVIPTTLADIQSILDNSSKNVTRDAGAAEVSSTDYYLTDEAFNALSSEFQKRMYTWQPDYLFDPSSNVWYYLYTSIYSANSALEGIEKIERNGSNQGEWDYLKGEALYLRARNFLQLAYTFTLAYDEISATIDLGLPLRLTTDFNEPSKRSNLQETYTQIITDLTEATHLLPNVPKYTVHPSRPAAFALLARTYLSMRKYTDAGKYADSCLQLFNTLIDYNTVQTNLTYPFEQFNDETIIYSAISSPAPISPSRAKIVPEVYNSYAEDDLRKTLFFTKGSDGSYSFRGSYTGTVAPFGGVSVNEVFLIRAEAFAREGENVKAFSDLNTLLANRWNKINGVSTFLPYQPDNSSEILALIINERRKELLMRGLRWMDIKRLNKEGQNITLTRFVNGQNYTLPPNDLRYALPIPEDIIDLSGIEQNPR